LDPGQSIPYAALLTDYMALDRLADAEAVYEDAKVHKVAAGLVEDKFYLLSFLKEDAPGMARVISQLSTEPGFQITALRQETNTAAYFGRLSEARQLTARMKEIALREKDTAVAADFLSDAAFREALVGNSNEARRYAVEAVKLGGRAADRTNADN